jgi:hypothetical protein
MAVESSAEGPFTDIAAGLLAQGHAEAVSSQGTVKWSISISPMTTGRRLMDGERGTRWITECG